MARSLFLFGAYTRHSLLLLKLFSPSLCCLNTINNTKAKLSDLRLCRLFDGRWTLFVHAVSAVISRCIPLVFAGFPERCSAPKTCAGSFVFGPGLVFPWESERKRWSGGEKKNTHTHRDRQETLPVFFVSWRLRDIDAETSQTKGCPSHFSLTS